MKRTLRPARRASAPVLTFKLDARPRGLRLDPDEWVLKVLNLKEG